MHQYHMITQIVYDELQYPHEVFGIAARDGSLYMDDIFFKRDEAQHFVDICNSEHLSSAHVLECIQDIVSQ